MNIVQNLLDRVESLSIQLGKLEVQLLQAIEKKDDALSRMDHAEYGLKCALSDRDFYKKENEALRQEVQAMKDKLYMNGAALAEKIGKEVAEKYQYNKSMRIQMIKEVRERASCGLKEAKEAIDKLVPSGY